MSIPYRQLIGVEFCLQTIRVCRFNSNGYPLGIVELLMPQPAMPGAVTVDLCEAIVSIDQFLQTEFVGIALPGQIDSSGRVVQSCIELPGWINVPLADWMESRLSRTVVLVNLPDCSSVSETFRLKHKRVDDDNLCSVAAAILSFERLNSITDVL